MVLTWSRTVHGVCHINPRDKSSVISAMQLLGYVVDLPASASGMAHASSPWFQHNVFVYRRRDHPPKHWLSRWHGPINDSLAAV